MLNDEERKILEEFSNQIRSPDISKFRKISLLIDAGLGNIILKSDDSVVFNELRKLGSIREVLPIWNSILTFILNAKNTDPIRPLGTVYFSIADCLYNEKMTGWGRFYLKAYLDDLRYGIGADIGPASDALRHRCQLGESGFENLKSNLQMILESRDMSSINKREFEKISGVLESRIPLEHNAEIHIPFPIIQEIIMEIKNSLKDKKKNSKWRELELLCQVIFSSVNGFRYVHNQASTLYQLDGVIYNDSNNPLFSNLGKIIVVEAKNYSKSVISRKAFDIVHMNMERSNAQSAFFITSSNISESAAREIYAVYRVTKRYIIPIYLSELESVAREKTFLPILISDKMERIRKGDKNL